MEREQTESESGKRCTCVYSFNPVGSVEYTFQYQSTSSVVLFPDLLFHGCMLDAIALIYSKILICSSCSSSFMEVKVSRSRFLVFSSPPLLKVAFAHFSKPNSIPMPSLRVFTTVRRAVCWSSFLAKVFRSSRISYPYVLSFSNELRRASAMQQTVEVIRNLPRKCHT